VRRRPSPSTTGLQLQYYGFIFLLKNPDGKVIFQRVTPSKFEWGIEPIMALKAKEAFDKTFKSKGTGSIRLY